MKCQRLKWEVGGVFLFQHLHMHIRRSRLHSTCYSDSSHQVKVKLMTITQESSQSDLATWQVQQTISYAHTCTHTQTQKEIDALTYVNQMEISKWERGQDDQISQGLYHNFFPFYSIQNLQLSGIKCYI